LAELPIVEEVAGKLVVGVKTYLQSRQYSLRDAYSK
jgi:hypothetical protein